MRTVVQSSTLFLLDFAADSGRFWWGWPPPQACQAWGAFPGFRFFCPQGRSLPLFLCVLVLEGPGLLASPTLVPSFQSWEVSSRGFTPLSLSWFCLFCWGASPLWYHVVWVLLRVLWRGVEVVGRSSSSLRCVIVQSRCSSRTRRHNASSAWCLPLSSSSSTVCTLSGPPPASQTAYWLMTIRLCHSCPRRASQACLSSAQA